MVPAVPDVVEYRSLDFMGYARYSIGTDGSLWSRYVWGGQGSTGPWVQKKPTSDGIRMVVKLVNANGGKTFNVHRLVLTAFVGPCPEGMECCHSDGDHRNNRLDNLRWDTHSSNELDKLKHGTHNRGERNHFAKLTEVEVREIRRLYATGRFSMSNLARRFGITLGTVHPIIHYKTWRNVR